MQANCTNKNCGVPQIQHNLNRTFHKVEEEEVLSHLSGFTRTKLFEMIKTLALRLLTSLLSWIFFNSLHYSDSFV